MSSQQGDDNNDGVSCSISGGIRISTLAQQQQQQQQHDQHYDDDV